MFPYLYNEVRNDYCERSLGRSTVEVLTGRHIIQNCCCEGSLKNNSTSIALIFKAKPSLTLAVMSRDRRVGSANTLDFREQRNASRLGAGLRHSLSDIGF